MMSYTFMSVNICFNDKPTTEIYTLSLHDALPIYKPHIVKQILNDDGAVIKEIESEILKKTVSKKTSDFIQKSMYLTDRKSTRLNSSHVRISYAVFCLKKKMITC